MNAPASSDHDSLSLWQLLAILVGGRRVIVTWSFGIACLAVGIGLVLPSRYTVVVSFRPQSSSPINGQLSSLAAQFGFALPGSGGDDSPDFYEKLVGTPAVLEQVAKRSFVAEGRANVRLDSLVGASDDDPRISLKNTVEWLKEDALRTSVDRNTGTVTIRVRTRWPEVSRDIAVAVLEEVDRFNASSRQGQAREEADFVRERLESAQADLVALEDSLKAFLAANRRYADSPDLLFEHDRLQRELGVRLSIVSALRQGLEQAGITALRNTPVITVVEPSVLPPEADSRLFALRAVLGGLIGGVLGLGLVLARTIRPPDNPTDLAAYNEISVVLSGLLGRRRSSS